MHNRLATVAALALSLIATTAAYAEGVRTEKNISLDLANQIAAHTVAACSASTLSGTVSAAGTSCPGQRAPHARAQTVITNPMRPHCRLPRYPTTIRPSLPTVTACAALHQTAGQAQRFFQFVGAGLAQVADGAP